MITITLQDDVDLFCRIITIIYTIANVLKFVDIVVVQFLDLW